MADTDVARQPQHVLTLEHVLHQAVILALTQSAVVVGHDARRILTAVLKHDQRIVDGLIDRFITDYSDDAAHCSLNPPCCCRLLRHTRSLRSYAAKKNPQDDS